LLVATAVTPANLPQQSNPTFKSDYTPLTAQQVFAKYYSKVDLVCSLFVVDHPTILKSDVPAQVLTIGVFPETPTATMFSVNTTNSGLAVTGSLAVRLGTMDMSTDGQMVGQTPAVEVSGTADGIPSKEQDTRQEYTTNLEGTVLFLKFSVA
jgi:magnesium-transporting ATPase (P-type)